MRMMRKFLLVLLTFLVLLTGCIHRQHDFGPTGVDYNRSYKSIIADSELNYCYLTDYFSVAVEKGLDCPDQSEVEVSAMVAAQIHGRNLEDLGYPFVIFTRGPFKCGSVVAIGCTIVGSRYDDFILIDGTLKGDPSWNWVMQHEFLHQWLSNSGELIYLDGDCNHSHPDWSWAY
jgi:hypothetical protein